ncbi:ABC transporter substrate-binding protein [Rubellimicrobium arenae]|uniref:ABC transporter substrate-binding protein n=1 Tax=Rubellimicrobium arenae TaxID=2817372 RepID=UPI001FEE2A82|nr:ABC transporter substrate-binding protein [Rubellimicrobium arenae]
MRKTLLATLLATTAAFAAPAMAERVLRLDESPVGEIDPAKGVDYADTVLAVNLYETLVYPTQGGPGVQPMLATEWTIDGSTYTFKLRDDAVFSSGNPVTAADVVYSFDRLMAMGQGSASLFVGRVAGVEAVDDHTVRFQLSEPFAPFLAALSRLSIVDSKTLAEHYGEGSYGEFRDYADAWLSQNSAGSGAYMVQSHDPQTETVMVRNPNYKGVVDPAAPETVRYRYGLEASTVRALMSRGEHDISSLWLPPEVLKAMADEGTVHLAPEPGGTGEYIKLNTQRAPLDDVHCRRALMYAYDYATTVQLLQVTPDLAQGIPMNGALPMGLTGHDPAAPGFTQDLARAQSELAECQYDPAQYPLDIAWIAEVPARERLALLMQATFSQLGFTVNVVRTPWALLTEQVTEPATAPHAVEIAVTALTPDPDSLLYNMYSSKVPPTWMSAEHLQDEEVDRLLEAGRTETDEGKRAEIYKQLNARLTELAPDIFAYEFTGAYAIRNGVEVPALEDDSKRYPLQSFNMLFKDMRVTE